MLTSLLLGVARADDELLRRFVFVAGALTFGRLTPWGHRVTTTGGTTFTTTVRVIDRVHNHTTHRRTLALVAHTAGFTKVLVGVVRVGHGTNGGHAFLTDEAQFTRGQADLSVATITTNELSIGTGCTGDLAAFAGLHFDVVNDGTDRHARERHCVARLDVGFRGGDYLVTNCQTLRSEDIRLLAVFVFDQCDECGPVRVVFDPLDGRRNIEFVALEIDDPVETLCAAATTT
mmetsp:Transcript_10340/g.13500  ORF Transcript_10340/g.13500 Transcript_10340/m.13500 type:complete len:232 (+) Transcript_10340:1431-2126(+)